MRWFRLTKAKIDPAISEALETRGTETIRVLLLRPTSVLEKVNGQLFTVADERGAILQWLKEHADREERRETWLITMEAAITLFVLAELVMSVLNFLHGSK